MFVEREKLAEKSSSAEEKQFSLAFAACKNVIHATLLTNVSPRRHPLRTSRKRILIMFGEDSQTPKLPSSRMTFHRVSAGSDLDVVENDGIGR